MLSYREFRPAATDELVECFWLLEQGGAEIGSVQRVVPDGRAELILNFAQPLESSTEGEWRTQPQVFLAGQITGPLLLRSTAPAKILGVRFRPHGAAAALGLPMHETTDCLIPIDDFSPVLARSLDRVRKCESLAGQIESVEEAILMSRKAHRSNDLLIAEAVKQVELGAESIAQLAARLGISSRQLERRFLHSVGLPPKLYVRMRRFQRVFRAIDEEPANWAAIAFRCGYYDQAHLIRDFKEFTGDCPTALLRATDLATHFLDRP